MEDLLSYGFWENADRTGEILYSEVIAEDLVASLGFIMLSVGVFIVDGIKWCKIRNLVVNLPSFGILQFYKYNKNKLQFKFNFQKFVIW